MHCRCHRWSPPPRGTVFWRQPKREGFPVQAKIRFCGTKTRMPWPFESETRQAGTGLAMGKRHRNNQPLPPWPWWERQPKQCPRSRVFW